MNTPTTTSEQPKQDPHFQILRALALLRQNPKLEVYFLTREGEKLIIKFSTINPDQLTFQDKDLNGYPITRVLTTDLILEKGIYLADKFNQKEENSTSTLSPAGSDFQAAQESFDSRHPNSTDLSKPKDETNLPEISTRIASILEEDKRKTRDLTPPAPLSSPARFPTPRRSNNCISTVRRTKRNAARARRKPHHKQRQK